MLASAAEHQPPPLHVSPQGQEDHQSLVDQHVHWPPATEIGFISHASPQNFNF